MMKTYQTYFSLLFILMAFTVNAQDIAYGFKAGLNFNRFISDSEVDANGVNLEEFTGKTGFHVGATFTWKATELMGLRGELLYSQKGGKRRFDGPSFYDIQIDPNGTGDIIETTGNRRMFVSVANSYIDIPVMGYAKLFKWLEVYAGANVGVLITSSAVGDLQYSGVTSTGVSVEQFDYEFNYRFGSDEVGEFEASGQPEQVQVGNLSYDLPRRAGAYYEYDRDRGNLYKALDLGLVGGLSVYLNEGLYVSVRANYGLTDITRTEADISYQSRDNGSFIERNDKDRNFAIQTSIGFSF